MIIESLTRYDWNNNLVCNGCYLPLDPKREGAVKLLEPKEGYNEEYYFCESCVLEMQDKIQGTNPSIDAGDSTL